MIITEKNRYLAVPTRREVEAKRVYFYNGDTLLRDVLVCVDFENPDYVAYYDMISFMGMDIRIEFEDGEFETSDRIIYGEDDAIRPKLHFTAKRGFINDPNGLIFYEERYHAFCQWNPMATCSGSQHWGHYVSDDLINWEDWGIALFPDEFGTMYSGCAIIDKENVLGLNTDEHQALVLFYTASGGKVSELAKGKPYVQCMAVSTDGGRTFEKYKNNPVVGPQKAESRDPMVAYDEQNKMFVMVFFLEENDFIFFKSYNLTDWTYLCTFTLEGDRVCPDLYTLKDGDKTRWVLSAGQNVYVTADMDAEKGLVNVSKPKKFGFGAMYAAQSLKKDGKVLRFTWVRFKTGPMAIWGKGDLVPTRKYSQFWSIPVEMGLSDGELTVKPYFDFEKTLCLENVELNTEIELPKKPLELYIRPSKNTDKLSLEIFGNTIEIDGGKIRYSTLVGDYYELPYEGEIRLFADILGYDLFSSNKYYASYCALSNYDMSTLKISGEGKLDVLELGAFEA